MTREMPKKIRTPELQFAFTSHRNTDGNGVQRGSTAAARRILFLPQTVALGAFAGSLTPARRS
jgi:hypothetical protein